MRPMSRASTDTRVPTSMNILEPFIRQAFSLTTTSSDRLNSPRAISAKTT